MSVIKKEDYDEPCCPFDLHPETKPISIGRVIEKLDEYLGKNDYVSAERHLKYWLSEAEFGNDLRGKLSILNEQIGLYRKLNKEKECLTAIDSALSLADVLKMDNTITLGTTLVNAATGYKAFHQPEKALLLYEKALIIYESLLNKDDSRLGGLYNNMALTLAELKEFDKAEDLYNKALFIMEKQEQGELEMAITYLNLADLVSAKYGMVESEKQINEYIEKAENLLNTDTLIRNGYYAFVCEKCASVFGYYGYFLIEQELTKRAREIYERS